MKKPEDIIKKYELSGGGTVRVCKPFGDNCYCAVVEQQGRYPEAGKIARNKGRREFSLILEGQFTYTIDGKRFELKTDGSILVDDGQTYGIQGKGKVLVMVQDQPGGTTQIEDCVA
jgi:mannose-6-phosphate isomerase-like protein (cupin superfamily)